MQDKYECNKEIKLSLWWPMEGRRKDRNSFFKVVIEQLEGMNESEYFRQGKQKCKGPEAGRSLNSLWAEQRLGP